MSVYEPSATAWEENLRELRVRLLSGLAFIVVVMAVGTVGFRVVDPSAGWIRALFMTVITLTTVGYGHEVGIDSDGARLFTAALILVGMGGVLYFVSTTTAFILEGELGQVFRRRRMERELESLSGHLVVCGSGRTAVYAARELVSVRRPVVLVIPDPEAAERVRSDFPGTPIVVGDPGEDAVLRAAGVERASGLVACTDADRDNLVVSLAARQMNPRLRIISRVEDVDAGERVRKVGADAVVSPDFIGGLRIASELIRPTVVTFLDTMLRDRDLNLRIDEVRIPEGSPTVGRAINELGLEKVPHALLLAVRDADGAWRYNPRRTERVAPGTVLIFLGSPDDARALCEALGGEMLAAPTA